MKLRRERVDVLSDQIVKILESEDFIEVLDAEEAFNVVQTTIIEDLMIEDKLDEEVHKILEEYADKMEQDRIQYYQMFKMVKDKLAKEKNLIL